VGLDERLSYNCSVQEWAQLKYGFFKTQVTRVGMPIFLIVTLLVYGVVFPPHFTRDVGLLKFADPVLYCFTFFLLLWILSQYKISSMLYFLWLWICMFVAHVTVFAALHFESFMWTRGRKLDPQLSPDLDFLMRYMPLTFVSYGLPVSGLVGSLFICYLRNCDLLRPDAG
jgi:hypothetical protein